MTTLDAFKYLLKVFFRDKPSLIVVTITGIVFMCSTNLPIAIPYVVIVFVTFLNGYVQGIKDSREEFEEVLKNDN